MSEELAVTPPTNEGQGRRTGKLPLGLVRLEGVGEKTREVVERLFGSGEAPASLRPLLKWDDEVVSQLADALRPPAWQDERAAELVADLSDLLDDAKVDYTI